MSNENIFSCCGTLCTDCGFYKGIEEPRCPGCTALKGKPFWGECGVYACTKDKDVKHCGACGVFPCSKFIEQYDPSYGPVSAVVRAGILAYRARHGDAKAVELVRKIR